MANKQTAKKKESTQNAAAQQQEELIEQRNDRYNDYVKAVTPQSGVVKSLWHAFWVGGLTCCIAQAIFYIFKTAFPSMEQDMVANITSMTVITIAIILTGFGIYDKMARVGGAGTFLPITGFANAMVSASMEYKTEGLITGTSTKLFTVVGPVIVNGIVWSTVAAIIRWLISFGGI